MGTVPKSSGFLGKAEMVPVFSPGDTRGIISVSSERGCSSDAKQETSPSSVAEDTHKLHLYLLPGPQDSEVKDSRAFSLAPFSSDD